MANTESIDALRQELWSKELLDDVSRDVKNVLRFMGEDANNVIQVKRDLAKDAGDQETFGLITRLGGFGVTGDDDMEGQEEAMSSYAEVVAIDQIRNAVRTKGKLDTKKTPYDLYMKAKENVKVWMKEFIIQQFFLKAGGVTNTSLTDVNGRAIGTRALWSNTPDYIPDADEAAGRGSRYWRSGSTASGDGTDDLAAGDTLTLDDITTAAYLATLAEPKIQKISGDGEDFYVLFVHPLQARDLRKSTDWKNAQQNARERAENNPLFRGALGYWSNVLILENEFVPWLDVSVAGNSFRGAAAGTDCAVDAARAILCGRQAVLMAEATNPDAIVVKDFDYKNKEGVSCSFIGGLQKTVFNSKEFGAVVIDSAAAL